MKRIRRTFGLLVAAALVVSACGNDNDGTNDTNDTNDDSDAGGDPAPAYSGDDVGDETSVDGDWLLTRGFRDGVQIQFVDDRAVTMSIDGDAISGTADCNGYGGSVTVGDEFEVGGSFVVNELSWTEMGCEPEVMELEQQFLAALGEVDSYELADTLALGRAGVGTSLMFERVEPVADTELVGTTWVLDTVLRGDAASNSPGMDAAFLEFSEDGSLAGSTGCRRLEGEWSLVGATIRIPVLSAIDDPTAGACSPESEVLDGEVIAVVESGSNVEVEGDRLTLVAPGGDGLSFVAAAGAD